MKGLGALQRHQLPHPPCKNPGSATDYYVLLINYYSKVLRHKAIISLSINVRTVCRQIAKSRVLMRGLLQTVYVLFLLLLLLREFRYSEWVPR